MHISRSAQALDEFLSVKLRHKAHFSSAMEMVAEINSTVKLLEEKHPFLEENPFVTGVYAVTVDKDFVDQEVRLDRDRLFIICHRALSMTPVDEIAPTSISVFGRLCTPDMSYSDRLKSVKVITQLLIRANEMDSQGRENIVRHCASSIDHLRRIGCIDNEIEKEVTKNMYEADALKVVEHLDFDARNIQSLKRHVRCPFSTENGPKHT